MLTNESMATSDSDCEDFESADEGDLIESSNSISPPIKLETNNNPKESEKKVEVIVEKSANEANETSGKEHLTVEKVSVLDAVISKEDEGEVIPKKPKENIKKGPENIKKGPENIKKGPENIKENRVKEDVKKRKPKPIDDSKHEAAEELSKKTEKPKEDSHNDGETSKSHDKDLKDVCNEKKTEKSKPAIEEAIETEKDVHAIETSSYTKSEPISKPKSAVPKEKSTRILEESKSRAKSEEKPEDLNVKVARKLSNPEKSSRVMLHIEKKALEKNLTTKNQNSTQLTEKETSVLDRLSTTHREEKKTSPGWGGLGNWGTSFISSAASSVSTFTSHVTQGIETVIESVEATLGAPSPEELAANLSKNESNSKEEKETEIETNKPTLLEKQDSTTQSLESSSPKSIESHEGILPGSLLGGVSALTRAIESTGSKVISGGLDTLELIGKKTIDILTEGDPGLRKKRNIFSGDETTLSQVLREARDRLESSSLNDESLEDPFPVHYSKLFDEFQGLVHLEALEMLSSQSKTKLQDIVLMLETDSCDQLVVSMEEIRRLCDDLPPTDDTPDEEASQDFNKLLTEHVAGLPFNLHVDKIKNVQFEAREWVDNCKEQQEKREIVDAKEIYIKAITVLAKLSACMMELYHKIAELLLVSGPPLNELHNHCKHLTSLTAVLNLEIQILTSSFCQCLNTAADDSEDPDSVNPLITNIYLEASNSNSYIQDAFGLLIPVLQEIGSKSIPTSYS